MREIIELPKLPSFSVSSPMIVQVFDKIRFELENSDKENNYAEFCWFAREYPRCYRYHIDSAEYRLKSIYEKYRIAYGYFCNSIQNEKNSCISMMYSNKNIYIIYWDFESFLSSINISLDLLARIIGTAYIEQTPPSFNKLCKKNLNGPVDILKKAQSLWVAKMKDYRDCFVHYTPVDTLLGISAELYTNGWEIRGKLPVNPNARDILGFKYSRKVELLKYAISVYKHMSALDRTMAREIAKLYKNNDFPKRIRNLFFLGKR